MHEVDQPVERDENGLVTLSIGKHTLKVKELSGLESRRADALSLSNSDQERACVQALFAVRELDGVAFDPRSSADLDRVASRLTSSEMGVFLLAYADAFRNDELEEQAKKLVARLRPETP